MPPAKEGNPVKLLVLDDDAEVGQTITAIAQASGFEAISTTSANHFFDKFQTWQPSHIALDLIMPDIDGIEVLRQLGEGSCGSKIIIISGIGSRVLEAAYRSASEHGLQVIGTLSKPFSPKNLRDLLRLPSEMASPLHSGRTIQTADSLKKTVNASDLITAIKNHHISVWYQPKVTCHNSTLKGFEALVRWNHSQQGMIPPDYFIPFAEQAGLIDLLSDYIFNESLNWFSTHFSQSDLFLSVNISAKSLSDIRLADRIATICKNHAVAPQRIILELTETSAMNDPITTLDLLTRLRIKGMQLSIDDFGVGYSSLTRLARLPFSELKIDKMFVMNAVQSLESQNIIKAIIGLGHSLGLRITAEGVEDRQAFQFLQAANCDLAQGFWIAKPMNGTAAAHWADTAFRNGKLPLKRPES